jgi:hypothetical protein
MRHTDRWVAGVLIVFGLSLSACAAAQEETSSGSEARTIEPIEGTDLVRVILTAEAAERLEMQTAPVRDAEGTQTVIPYAAVFYGPTGDTWTYTSLEPLTFERASIIIDHFEGDLVFLSDGPPIGTAVVTQGAAELFGVETGVDS